MCERCRLVQLDYDVAPQELFRNYVYFSSYSDDWLAHAAKYCEMARRRFALDARSLVVEIASNDGYLLKNFVAMGIPVLGIDPSDTVAADAQKIGVPTLVEFFGEALARQLAGEGRRADLIIGNNVLAQVPDLNSFVAGIANLLKPTGTATLEFPHLQQLVDGNQFDTIYHEHFSYFSLLATERIFAAHGLVVFDVEELWTHGGSLRVWARPVADASRPVSDRVLALRAREEQRGYTRLETYLRFEDQVRETKRKLLELLIDAKRAGKRIAGYGAPGKGNTLLNYCGIRGDFLDFTVDRNPYKQGKFLPGTHVPILPPAKIDEAKPDYILILPWNFKDEIMAQLAHARGWGAKFIVPIPEATVVP
ncbi:MAG TPA: methyltransferase domain-containing protein [Polyangia bacterium]|nr:methyltransferase domain-containing protein [Polyangia bacterium]